MIVLFAFPSLLLLAIFLGFINSVFAESMESSGYKIQADSINVGGVKQTSDNYQSEDTIGEIGTGLSSSDNYLLQAGYQQMQEVYLGLSLSTVSVTMSPDIGGLSGGVSNGSTTASVITDSPSGYSLSVKASTAPAMATSTDSFDDYTPQTADPDFTWLISNTTSAFGFTPEGTDIVQKFQDNGVDTCNTGSTDTPDACWYRFATSTQTIAQKTISNHPAGSATSLKLKAESGTNHIQIAGQYQAVITITAVSN
ncbi:MAG: hypothetical protein PHE77_03460 [Candidatus Pacebacteria bacterium]|nr:hypothetical protein [Candidatus Paceibacterota bacterium]